MDTTIDQTASNDLDLRMPATIYSRADIREDALPSLAFAPGELGDLSSLRTDDWSLETFGYAYDTPHVYPDGRMDGALHEPEYYAYGPRQDYTWEDGLQAIEDFDWSAIEEVEEIRAMPELAARIPVDDSDARDLQSAEHLKQEQTQSPPRKQLPYRHLTDGVVKDQDSQEDTAIPLEAGHEEEMTKIIFPEQVPEPIATPEQNSSQEIDLVDAAALGQPVPAHSSPTPNPAIGDNAELEGPVQRTVDDAQIDSAVVEKSLGIVPASLSTPDVVQDDTPVEQSPAPQVPSKLSRSPEPASPPPIPTKDVEDGAHTEIECERQMWVAQLQEAAGTAWPAEPSQGHASHHEDAKSDPHESAWETDNEDTGSQANATPVAPSRDDEAELSHAEAPRTRGATLPSLSSLEELIVDAIPTPLELPAGTQKRIMPSFAKESSDTEADAPEKKRVKRESTTPEDSTVTAAAAPEDEPPTVTSKKPRRHARKSLKESPVEVMEQAEATEEEVEPDAPTVSSKSAVSRPAEIYFEEDTRPSENGPAALGLQEDDVEPSLHDVDEDMQEHLSDVQQTPTPTLARSPKNVVSNRELQALDSTLAPGMHLGLHFHQEQRKSRARTPVEPTKKNPNADNAFLIGGDEASERETTPMLNKKKRAGAAEKGPAPKRTKTTTETQPSARRERRKETAEPEANNEESIPLFPEPRIERSKPATDTRVLTPLPVVPFTSGKSKKTTKAAPRKSHARNDTAAEDLMDEDFVPAVDDDEDTLFPEDKAPAPSTPRAAKPKGRSKPNPNISSLLKQATSTPTPSVASINSSPQAKNKYGFIASPSPRKTRSAATAKGKAKATPRNGKAKENESGAVKSAGTTKSKAKHARVEKDGDAGAGKEGGQHVTKEQESLRRSTRHVSLVAPDTDTDKKPTAPALPVAVAEAPAAAPEPPRRSTRHISMAPPDTVNDAKPAAPTPAPSLAMEPRRSTRHVSIAAPDVEAAAPAPEPLRRSTRHCSVAAPDTDSRTEPETPAPAPAPARPIQSELRRSTRHASLAPVADKDTDAKPAAPSIATELRRSTRAASMMPPDTTPAVKKSSGVKVEVPEDEKRLTRRASAIEKEGKEKNISKQLRTGV